MFSIFLQILINKTRIYPVRIISEIIILSVIFSLGFTIPAIPSNKYAWSLKTFKSINAIGFNISESNINQALEIKANAKLNYNKIAVENNPLIDELTLVNFSKGFNKQVLNDFIIKGQFPNNLKELAVSWKLFSDYGLNINQSLKLLLGNRKKVNFRIVGIAKPLILPEEGSYFAISPEQTRGKTVLFFNNKVKSDTILYLKQNRAQWVIPPKSDIISFSIMLSMLGLVVLLVYRTLRSSIEHDKKTYAALYILGLSMIKIRIIVILEKSLIFSFSIFLATFLINFFLSFFFGYLLSDLLVPLLVKTWFLMLTFILIVTVVFETRRRSLLKMANTN